MKEKKEPLPKKYRGADIVYGLGLKQKAYDTLVEKHALESSLDLEIGKPGYLVTRRESHDGWDNPKLFRNKKDALRFARAEANGNVDHVVLEVRLDTTVIGTENEF